MLTVIIVLIFLVLLFSQFYTWPSLRARKLMSQTPGYSELQSWKRALRLTLLPLEDIPDFLDEIFSRHYPISSLWFLGKPNISIRSPEYIEILLKSVQHIRKGVEYFVFDPWLREGLLTSTGAKWHATRKMLTPAFHFRILENCLPIFNNNVQLLVELLKTNCKTEQVVKLEQFIPLCSLDIISEAAMGVRLDAQLHKSSTVEYVNAVRRLGELFLSRVSSLYKFREWAYNLTPEGWEQNRLLKLVHGFTESVISESKKKRALEKVNGKTDKKPAAFVDFLLEMAENYPDSFSDIEIRQEVDTFMVEGHETSSSAISWTLLLLGHDQEIQEKAHNELLDIFGESSRHATSQDLSKMVYLEAVIKESLRLYPPVAYISRILDNELQLGEYTLPIGSNLIIMPYYLHRQKNLYPNPEKFDPERFLSVDNLKRHPFMYIPFSGGPRNCIDIPQRVIDLFQPYYPIASVWQVGVPYVNIMSPDYAEVLLKSAKHIRKGAEYFFIKAWLREGLLTSTGEKWHAKRKLLTPAFHFRILENILPIFNSNSQLLVEILNTHCKTGEVVKLEQFIPLCSLDIISEAAMGVRLHAQLHKSSTIEYVNAVKRMGELILERGSKAYKFNEWVYSLTSEGREQKKLLKLLHGFTENVIEESKQKRALEKLNGTTGKKPAAFVDFLLEMAENYPDSFSNIEIRQEVDTFMVEGHETVSSAISWTLLLLGHDQKIQERAYHELLDIFGDSKRHATTQDLSKMVYLEAILKESLRIYPPVAYISRRLDTELQFGEYTAPAGANITLHPYHLHRQSILYPDPEKFDPERFISVDNLNRHPFMYIPFSGGPRNCIGQRFAMMELKIVISHIMRHFRIESETRREGLKVLIAPFLKPMEGTFVKLHPRM